jgi:hypothetical protein
MRKAAKWQPLFVKEKNVFIGVVGVSSKVEFVNDRDPR